VTLTRLRRDWEELGKADPLWAILTTPDKKGNRWRLDEFLQTGRDEVAELMARIEHLSVPARRRSALDFGCGVGRLTQALADHFESVVGVDISTSMLELAGRVNRHGARCRYVLNSASNLAIFESGTFDLIYSRLVLQHLPPRLERAYLTEMIRVLAPGGLLVFQLPSGEPAPVVGRGLKAVLPLRVVQLVRQLRRRLTGLSSALETHGLPPDAVRRIVSASGAVMVDVTPDQGHGTETPGFRYFVTKPG
jgi:ubiquinone/menaquinone biosynthesis C-methylase UbiE